MTAAMPAGTGTRKADPVHHLTDEILLDYSAGSLDEAMSLMVASHLTLCPVCRARVARNEALGGVMLQDMAPEDMEDDALDSIMSRLDSSDSGGMPMIRQGRLTDSANDNPVLPRVVQKYLGGDVNGIAWKRVGMGVETAEIALSGSGKSGSGRRAFLLRVPAGKAVPQHTHTGTEVVMMLQGSYTDEIGHFGIGDVAISDQEIDHSPMAGPEADCVCLVVIDAPIKLSGILGSILNMFVRV